MSQSGKVWRPADEAAAVGTMATFVEWLRSTGGDAALDPAAVRRWAACDRKAFHRVVARFAGLSAGSRLTDLLPDDARPALTIVPVLGSAITWTRQAVRHDRELPPAISRLLATADDATLVELAASHLLGHEIRPDQRLVWSGDPADIWPYGAWIVGAQVVLGRYAEEAGQRRFDRRPSGWADAAFRPPASDRHVR